ncbi:MAG: helix-turn-helix domain-containing protein [Patescibacteria group bacterium]|nr:helix-turn-helix domain-containing protein [Patescibacteria group bacterium]
MSLFKANKIYLDSETVSEQLRSGRQAKNLKLKDVAKKLNISEKYLDFLEKGEYGSLPHGVYGKNFLREYALFLGLDYNRLAKNYETEAGVYESKKQKEIFSRKVIKERYLWAMPKILRNIIIFLVIAVCFVYLGYRVNKIVSPPLLIIDLPSADITVSQTSLLVSGRTEAEANLTINGESVLSDKNGNFSKLINLKDGVNLINITASKKYSRNNTIIRQVLVND